jgi:pimeloyl-ACP methyl ester carboxylesterase
VKRLALATALLALALPASAAAAPDAPFGHACTAQNGVRFCPTASDDQRVPSFDGVPLDVDVTLPETGAGPFPTIVMLHGFPGTKQNFETANREAKAPDGTINAHNYHFNNVFYATEGYAVVTLSSRGFGRSCGVPDSRTSPQCDRGWVHPVADQRFELRDVQHLLGLLVDEGVTDPGRIGVTGTSMGGSMTMQLGFLRDKVRNTDGTLAPWTSPAGKPLEIRAAYPRWGVSDLGYSLLPNGRALDYKTPKKAEGVAPIGVAKETVLKLLAAGGVAAGYIAPEGADPTADLLAWQKTIEAGEPYGPAATAIAKQFAEFKGTPGLDAGNAAPLLIQVGWTDPVFPAIEAVRPLNRINTAVEGGADVAIQIGDIGHFTGGNPLGQYVTFNNEGAAFFARQLKGEGPVPAPGQVTAYLQGCPKGSKGSGAIRRNGWSALDGGMFVLKRLRGTVRSSGGDPATAKIADPGQTNDRCVEVDPGSSKGTTVLTRRSTGFTMLGLPRVVTTVDTAGEDGQLDALLWEVLPNGKQRIVDFGVYRLRDDHRGRITFQLQGNGYRFRKGSTIKLELRGRTPGLYRPSNGKFTVKLTGTVLEIPTKEGPSRTRGITRPRGN